MNVFYKESEIYKNSLCFFFFVFFIFWSRGWGGGREGKGLARVSGCFTMDPNKKNVFGGEGGGGSGGGGGGGGLE